MMLRSSSTPVLGSLLASSSSSSSSHNVSDAPVELSHLGKLPAISCSSSPVSPSVIDTFHGKGGGGLGFRRVRSEGNLASDGNQVPPHVATRPAGSVKILDSIPSFSFYNAGREDEEEEEDDEGSEVDDLDCGEVVVRNGVMIAGNLGSIVLDKKRDGFRQEAMYLAKGLGIQGNGGHGFCDYKGGFGGGSGRRGGSSSRSGGGGDGHGLDLEGYYEKMVEEDPGNPLFLRNYAQFLFKVIRTHPGSMITPRVRLRFCLEMFNILSSKCCAKWQVKGDLEKAEEYYSRAMLTDPGNGEILCQYAKLVWKLRRDRIMASSYFELAA